MSVKKYNNTHIDLSSRVLKLNEYTFVENPPLNLSLDDLMVCYSDTQNIKAVPLDIMKRYIILNDSNKLTNKNLSLIVCPYTLMSSKYEYNQSQQYNISVTNNIENGTIVLLLDKQNYDKQNYDKQKYDKNKTFTTFTTFTLFDEQLELIKSYDVQIKTLKNVFTDHIHALYFQLDKNIERQNLILDTEYYTNTKLIYPSIIVQQSELDNKLDNNLNNNINLIHPKTLVYVIIYKSSKTNKTKSTIIVGTDANKKSSSGYDTNISKFKKYFENNKEKIDEKNGYILPILWYASQFFFKESPIIFLSSVYK